MTSYTWCSEGSAKGLEAAIDKLYRELPGWWWSVGCCHLTADATIGPDRTGPDRDLLRLREFDGGIEANLPHPATLAEAMVAAIEIGKLAKSRATEPSKVTVRRMRDEEWHGR